MATMKTFVGDKWVELAKGKELFSKADKAGVPIMVEHPNGSFKVIRNADNLPDNMRRTSSIPAGDSPKEVEAKLEAAHKRANKIIEKAMTIDPAMVGA
tara:strand:+ start:392 stop:685 length:294 start_codon:yes stop_codon:yes gene_type:complete